MQQARTDAYGVSVNVFVFLGRHLPPLPDWQTELDRLGIDLRLDEGINPSSHSGYWPASVDGEPSGFEFYSGGVTDVFGTPAPPGIGDRDVVANFVTHSNMQELKCSMLAGAALAMLADGVVFDEDSGGTMDGEEFLAQARSMEL